MSNAQNTKIEIFLPKPHQNVQENSQTISTQYIGLHNHGNTCYLNSLLQTLYMTPKFKEGVINFQYNKDIHPDKKDCIPYQLKKLFARLSLKLRSAEDTINLTKSFQWDTHELLEQNDIQELLHLLFDAINEKFIYEIFQGEMSSVIKCTECSKLSTRKEKFIELSLPVKNNNKLIGSFEDSFNLLFSVEKLIGDNKYFCEKCNKKVEAEKYYQIDKFPDIFICALNRFEYDFNMGFKKKINSQFSFPYEFNINKLLNNESNSNDDNYFLYAIIVHSGSARGGHYYTIIKSYDDDKWYKFDDSSIYEISIDEIIKSLYGSDNSDTSGYILLYQNSALKNTKFDFGSNESNNLFLKDVELKNEIDQEEVEYKKFLEEEKERMSYLNIRVSYNEKIDFIKIKKYETVKVLKLKMIELFKINTSEDNTRIREMNSNHNKIINILSDESLTLEQCNIMSNKFYDLELKKQNEQFPEFNPNEITVHLIMYNKEEFSKEKNDISKFLDSIAKKIMLDKNIKKKDFINKINKIYELNENNYLIMRKEEYGVNNFKLIELNERTEVSFYTDEMKIYIEPISSNNTEEKSDYIPTTESNSFKQLFESQIPNVKVVFNKPLDLSKIKKLTVKSYSFDNSLEIHPKKTINDLKELISEKINVPVDNFILKKNSHNGVEIKKYTDTIDKYTSKVLILYIQYGVPLKLTDIKLVIRQYIYNYEEFLLYPYKINNLLSVKTDKTYTVKKFLDSLIETNKMLNKEGSDGCQLFLRKENNFKPGRIYNMDDVIEKTDIKENSTLIVQYINKNNLFIFDEFILNDDSKNIIQFIIRLWDQNLWKLSEPFEIIVNKKITLDEFMKNCLKKIFDSNNYTVNYNELYGCKIFNKEMCYFIDDIEKMEFYSFTDYKQSLLENFPFMINTDSCLLFIKDLSKEYREPSEKEKEYYYNKKFDSNSLGKNEKVNNKSGVNKKKEGYNTSFKKDVYREKAMMITAKHKEDEVKDVENEHENLN